MFLNFWLSAQYRLWLNLADANADLVSSLGCLFVCDSHLHCLVLIKYVKALHGIFINHCLIDQDKANPLRLKL